VRDEETTTIYGLAMGAPDVAPRQLVKAFDTVLRTRGGRSEEEADATKPGVQVDAALHAFEVHGAWVTIFTTDELPLSIARELSAKLGRGLIVHVLSVKEEIVETEDPEDESGYRNQHRSLDVRIDGTMRDRESPLDPEYAAVAHGDFAETARALLWAMVTEQDTYTAVGEPRRVAYQLPPPRTTDLPARLAEITSLIDEAGSWSVQDVGGQTMVRLTLPDGSRRFSRVSKEELAQIRGATDIEPT
jgi:hypothetical protein